ncbi:MAG: ribbon-helix-helix protein, CopG family [Actinomycetota bacterium]|nr:ribbon-helix-helix protein, CopG family [Actinomycetota bacterium]
MARFTVFLPDELLAQIDSVAESADRSRSSVIREASAHYLAHARSAEADARRKSAVEESLELFEELAQKSSLDGRPSLEILREARGRLDEYPP